MDQFTGKVAVITGGASGIGFSLAKTFAAQGMHLVLADLEAPELETTAAQLRADGADVLEFHCNVADAAAVDALAAATFERFGTAHIVCNNAGVGGAPGLTWEVSLEGWEWTFAANLHGVIHGIRSFAPKLIEQGEGHIVNTASLAGLKGAPFMSAYVATKHAVVGISECLALELAMTNSGVGVSVLCPAFLRTRIAESGRLWPDRLGPNPMPDAGEGSFIRELVANGKDPDWYAGEVLDAIRTDRFFVLSDPAHAGAISARYQEAVDGTQPTMMNLASSTD